MYGSDIHNRSTTICAALLAAALAAPGLAQQSEDANGATEATSGPAACLNQAEIRRAKILSNRNIVFVTRFEEIYNNELPKECPGLQRNSLVSYPVTSARLCAGDRFQVLWEQRPGSYMPAALCPLGRFVPITATELEDLMSITEANRGRRQRGRSTREAVTTEQVELPAAATPAPVPPPDAGEPASAE